MNSDILILSDSLVEPPSETYAIRTVTMICHNNMNMECLFHTTQNMKDLFFHWMKPKGMMDFICYIMNETEWQDGIRVDTERFYPNTIVEKWIRLENQLSLIGKIKSYKSR